MLRERCAIGTLAELLQIFEHGPPPRGPRFSYPLPRERRLGLPTDPGVYRFLGGGGDVLYVGKAAALRQRVNSYYRMHRAQEKLLEIVSQARDVDITVTATAVEAALLEVEEIQRLDPLYNRALRRAGREVWFLSDDLTGARTAADEGHLLGPFPDRRPVTSLDRWRRSRATCASPDAELPLSPTAPSPERPPAPGALAAGIGAPGVPACGLEHATSDVR
jgi:DNA polymerase-3 subunit epsilon